MRPPFWESSLGIAMATALPCVLLVVAALLFDNASMAVLLLAAALAVVALALGLGFFIKDVRS
jgi:hypothetical protein